ncbi:MAG: hypothetical protein OXQ89_03630 [Rhodospirillaceae bacterium]|nr:hypothetical protein [Rhodospirillaceae bacterium]MDE0359787.1 hypothetical protein [Rhodospirillaceae bacterium]
MSATSNSAWGSAFMCSWRTAVFGSDAKFTLSAGCHRGRAASPPFLHRADALAHPAGGGGEVVGHGGERRTEDEAVRAAVAQGDASP